jgi:hypothetical protein
MVEDDTGAEDEADRGSVPTTPLAAGLPVGIEDFRIVPLALWVWSPKPIASASATAADTTVNGAKAVDEAGWCEASVAPTPRAAKSPVMVEGFRVVTRALWTPEPRIAP